MPWVVKRGGTKYRVGSVVSDEIGELWSRMYKVPPADFVADSSTPKVVPVPVVTKKTKSEPSMAFFGLKKPKK